MDIVLYPREGYADSSVELRKAVYGRDILLRMRPRDAGRGTYDVQLYPAAYFDKPTVGGGPAFPTQYAGLRTYYGGAVRELCLVAEADAPSGMGGVFKVRKGGVNYAVYIVETTDGNATPVRVRTSTGVKAIRLKT